MTPALLRDALAVHAPELHWPDEPEALAAAVEAAAERHPGDPAWTNLVLAAHDLATPPPDLPDGLRARVCVRVDRLSSTWTALDAEGTHWIVRAPRRGLAPVHHRVLERDRRGLAGLVPGLVDLEGMAVAPAPGTPLEDASVPPDRAVRLVSDTLALLDRWRAAGCSPGIPHPEELRWVDGRVQVVALTPSHGPGVLDAVVERLPRLEEGPVQRFMEGLKALDAQPAEASELFRRALTESLSTRAIELRRRHLTAKAGTRRLRLHQVVERLGRAVPPPCGRGPIGYDLEGRPTEVASDGAQVHWGTDATATVFDGDQFDAKNARRFLRACATAPARPESDGDPAVTDALGRWVSAGLKLRTVRLLLEKA